MSIETTVAFDLFRAVNRALTASGDLAEAAAEMTQLIVGTLGIKGCTIFVSNPETESLEMLGSFGLSIGYLNKGPVLVKKSLYDQLKDRPIVISEVTSTEQLQYPQDARKEGVQAIVSIPIRIKSRRIGVLRLYHFEPWPVSPTDLGFLELLAGHVGLAMSYMRLHHALETIQEVVGNVAPVWFENH